MQIDLDKEDEFDITHSGTGIPFRLRPISPRQYEQLQRSAGKSDGREADPIKFSALFAEAAIVSWHIDDQGKRIGVKQDCTPENRRRFGEKFAFNVVPWIVVNCMDAAHSMEIEVGQAKNA